MRTTYFLIFIAIISMLILLNLSKIKKEEPKYKLMVIQHDSTYTLLTQNYAYDELTLYQLDSLIFNELLKSK